MAARLNGAHQDDIRAKIQTSQLINRLQDYALEQKGVELDNGRLKAIEMLLRKALPDLAQVAHTDADGNPLALHFIIGGNA